MDQELIAENNSNNNWKFLGGKFFIHHAQIWTNSIHLFDQIYQLQLATIHFR